METHVTHALTFALEDWGGIQRPCQRVACGAPFSMNAPPSPDLREVTCSDCVTLCDNALERGAFPRCVLMPSGLGVLSHQDVMSHALAAGFEPLTRIHGRHGDEVDIELRARLGSKLRDLSAIEYLTLRAFVANKLLREESA